MPYISTRLKEMLSVERIITIHYFEYMKNFSYQGESHDFWELVCVDRGSAEVQADEKVFTLHKGDCIFHKPMEFHAFRSSGQTSLSLFVLSFECSSAEMSYFEDKIFHLSDENKALLSNIIQEARLAFSTPMHIPSVEQVVRAESAPFGAEQLIKLYLEMFLIHLVRAENPLNIQPKPTFEEHISNDSTLDRILQYLEIHICEHLTIKQICNDNLIGRSCLQSLFHKEMNCGVIEYFNQMKMNVAKQIIRDNTKNFSEIADFLSYNSLPYFSRQFKKITGMSPSEYASSIKGISEKTSALPPQKKEVLRS